jgi:hypothetical protein
MNTAVIKIETRGDIGREGNGLKDGSCDSE